MGERASELGRKGEEGRRRYGGSGESKREIWRRREIGDVGIVYTELVKRDYR